MKYSLQQLKKYVPELIRIPTNELIERIWTSIAEVEEVIDLGKRYEGIVLARVTSVDSHPRSEKLVVARVDVGQKELVTVVTAAKNMQAGDLVPYIPVGVKVPNMLDEKGNQIEIGVRTMAGIPSVGMLASEKELGISDDHSGIMIINREELKRDVVPGESIAAVLGFDDVIFEIENKSLTHRGDCFSAAGLARELATLYNFDLVLPTWQTPELTISEQVGDVFEQELPSEIDLDIQATAGVERYSAVMLDNIQVAQSPLWLRAYLSKMGVNSVNNVVDVTNYVMLEYGQPLHAFDSSYVSHKTRGGKLTYGITVRYAKAGETLMTLEGKERQLPQIAIVIAEAKKALGIAGIIGGKESGISETTSKIILESAVFNKYAIRNTSMSLGINTDASVIFSRKQDTEKTVRALLRTTHLLMELAQAKIVSPIADICLAPNRVQTSILSHKRIESFLGIAVSPNAVVTTLTNFGCSVVKKNEMYRIEPPSWRPDLVIDEDYYEEIARVVGYKEIVPELPKRGIFGVSLSTTEKMKQATLKTLTGLGLSQSMNFSFVSKKLYQRCQLSVEDSRSIVNAISPDVEFLRKQVLPGLVEQVSKNQYNADRFGLFEIGKVSRKNLSYLGNNETMHHMPPSVFGIDELGLPIEDEHLAISIIDDTEQPGFFTLKKVVKQYFSAFSIALTFVHPDDISKKELKSLPLWTIELLNFFRRGRVALVFEKKSNEYLGIIGEPSVLVSKEFGFTKQTAFGEFALHKISLLGTLEPSYREPSRYPIVVEDLCFEVPVALPYDKVFETISGALQQFENDVTVKIIPRDIYQKKEGSKQITHRVIFSPLVGSLTDNQVKTYRKAVVSALSKIDGTLI